MRGGILVVLLATGCGVQINGEERQTETPDAAARGDASVDAASVIFDGSGMPTYLAACMAKGYAASGTLTSLYRSAAAEKEWLAAEAECAADVPGATHLVVLSSTAEVQYIQTRLGWVGLSDRATENLFVNVTAEPADVRPWISGQPDNGGGNENCVQMKSAGLDDDQCGNTHSFVCECDGRAPTP